MAKVKKMFKKLGGFSLIELIIVMAIISVLAASGFLVLTKWMGKRRDASKIQNLGQLKDALEVFIIKTEQQIYPDPDNSISVVDSDNGEVWFQGKISEGVQDELAILTKHVYQPDGTDFDYSVLANKSKFGLRAKLENGQYISSVLNSAYAQEEGFNYIIGNYPDYILSETGSKIRMYNIPSLFLTQGFGMSGGTLTLIPGSNSQFALFNEDDGAASYLTGWDVNTLFDLKSTELDKALLLRDIEQQGDGESVAGIVTILNKFVPYKITYLEDIPANYCEAGSLNGVTYSSVTYNYPNMVYDQSVQVEESVSGTIYSATTTCNAGTVDISDESSS